MRKRRKFNGWALATFTVLGPPLGAAMALVRVSNYPPDPAHFTLTGLVAACAIAIFAIAFAYLIGGISAFCAGILYSCASMFLTDRAAARAWIRLLIGAASGLIGVLPLVFLARNNNTDSEVVFCIFGLVSGAVCGLLSRGAHCDASQVFNLPPVQP